MLATAMLKDNVPLRRGGFNAAVNAYTELMTKQGRNKEAFDFLTALYPELPNFEQNPPDFKVMSVRRAGIELMAGFAPREEYLAALGLYQKHEDEAELPWANEPFWQISRLLMHGELEQARLFALNEDLSRNVTESLGAHNRYETPLYRELANMPEVAARIRERNAEIAALRSEVEAMLLQPEWNQ